VEKGFDMSGSVRLPRPLTAIVAVLLAVSLLVVHPPPSHAAEPPDQLDPPAPGEADYPDDPSEPDGERAFAAHPSPSYEVRGARFRPQMVDVVSGANRFETSVAASRTGWPGTARAVVLATGEDYANALAASALAGTVGGPLLLTPTAFLYPGLGDEIDRLRPETVYVVGMLDSAVEAAVAARGHRVERVGSGDRYGTSYDLARRAIELGASAGTVLVASGDAFPDALAASALAAGLRLPILLVPAAGGGEELRAAVAELGSTRVWVIGGPAAVPDETVAGLPGLERLYGAERTATARAVAERAYALGLQGRPLLASADTFPDGLSGGVLAGVASRAPILLTHRRELSAATYGWLDGKGFDAVIVVGGSAAVSPMAVCQARAGDTRAFLCVEQELARQGYNTGAVDGRVDHQTVWAFLAFRKVAGLPVNGRFDEAAYQRLLDRPRLAPRRPDLGNHVEIDLARQLVLVVRDGQVRHALHTSSGKPSTPTVRGLFSVYEKRNYRQSHNAMYRPVFFHRGYAFHGYPEIPLYPASAGCARLYDGDMDFLWPFLNIGTRVASY
jgi:putative cell wall-binding protein